MFISHTYSHICDLDTANFSTVDLELKKSMLFYYYRVIFFLFMSFMLICCVIDIVTAKQLFDNDLSSPCFSLHSLVNPCITGLFNGQALRALKANGTLLLFFSLFFSSLLPSLFILSFC